MNERIKFSCYKYAPETAKATCNGQPVNIAGTMIPNYIACRNTAEAIKGIKKLYREQNRHQKTKVYIFFEQGTKKFYYIPQLAFKESANLETRLQCYKDSKNHFIKNPIEIITESGHITPTGAEKPETKKQIIQLDFSRVRKTTLNYIY